MRYAILVTGTFRASPTLLDFLHATRLRMSQRSRLSDEASPTRLFRILLFRSFHSIQLTILGPAGSGKSTFCNSIISHAQSIGRNINLFNLDPAADKFEYPPTIDIRDLISLEDVMEEMEFGPNGGLIYCFE